MQALLPWKSNKHYTFLDRAGSLRYPACEAHAPYCHLWPVWLYNIFPHYTERIKIRYTVGIQ